MAAANLKDFIAYLKASSSKLSYGHAGVGSIAHVSGLVFNAKFDLTSGNSCPIAAPARRLQDLVAGQIDYMVDQSLNVIPQIKAGTIKVYAVAAPERLASLPDVPTTDEAGVDFIFSAWNAMVAPKGTPKEIVDKLADALSKALDDPAVLTRYVELGSFAPQGRRARARGPAEAGRKRGRPHHPGHQGRRRHRRLRRFYGINDARSKSWPGLSRPSTSLRRYTIFKTWMPATSAGMTSQTMLILV